MNNDATSGTLRGALTPDLDAALVALSSEFMTAKATLDNMLAEDSRDFDQIPDAIVIADRQHFLKKEIASINARTTSGLIAKAKVFLLICSEVVSDNVESIGRSMAIDVLLLNGEQP